MTITSDKATKEYLDMAKRMLETTTADVFYLCVNSKSNKVQSVSATDNGCHANVENALQVNAQGVQGVKGDTGDPGSAGGQGPPGSDGSDGAEGAAGADGEAGLPGMDGANGADGAQGPAGGNGADGPAGMDGADGGQGPAGADGVSPFMLSGSDVYYDIGSVAIGTDSPAGTLHVLTTMDEISDAKYIAGSTNGCSGDDQRCFQSFKALTTGKLTRIKVPICNTDSVPQGAVDIFAGDCATPRTCDGSTGLLGTTSSGGAPGCDISGPNTEFVFSSPVQVTAGEMYTFNVRDVVAYVDLAYKTYPDGASFRNSNIIGDVPFETFVVAEASVVIDASFVYWGEPTADTSWRVGPLPDGSFVLQQLSGGVWITKNALA
jgi:hypothetical protein